MDRVCGVCRQPVRVARLAAEDRLHEKASERFDAGRLAAIGRIFAREAAIKVAEEGLRWIVGAADERRRNRRIRRQV